MTSPRYRITSPLHALLALEQGFKLQVRHRDGTWMSAPDALAASCINNPSLVQDGFYIAPESEHLCEPQAGDLVYRGIMWDIVDHVDGDRAWFGDGDGYRYANIEIILRNGEPFPKIERVEL